MQTNIVDELRETALGQEADAILRRCTHCGFCLANCPTYRLLGDELDSPRGRIYLVKNVLEGAEPTATTRLHLDRCLTCRACETTCPSGVEYGRLADIGRELVEKRTKRPLAERVTRGLIRAVLPRRQVFGLLLALGRPIRRLLPQRLRAHIPGQRRAAPPWPHARGHERHAVLLEGCVQPALAPAINPRTARVLDGAGIDIARTPGAGCCGAIDQHLGAPEAARRHARRNIDAWWPAIEAGAEAVVVNASGCAAQVRDYGRLLADDPAYAERAAAVAERVRDPVELLEAHAEGLRPAPDAPRRIAFQTPCSLQHALGLGGRVDALLARLGFELTPVRDAHICCGSAGTYSVFQPELAERLRRDKLAALTAREPEAIATANVGCLNHLAAASETPVYHWLELVEPAS